MKKKYAFPINKIKKIGLFLQNTWVTLEQKKKIYHQSEKIYKKTPKLDLHGFSLVEANKIVKKFIIESSHNIGYKKILIITGKGLRSKSHNNPYVSEKLSMLKYSIPEYIKNNESLR